jgi:hypothetical protein
MKRALSLASLFALSLSLLGCGEGPTSSNQPGIKEQTGVTQAGVLTFATFARVLDDEKDIAEGLNVDGLVSTDGDVESCGKLDFTSPDGEPGIDNQFGGLLPVIEKYVGSENIGQLLAAAIANGQLLIVIAVDHLDDPKNDDDVTVRIAAGRGIPLLDATGKLIDYQTFGIDLDTAPVSKLPGSVKDGVLTIGPGDAVLPVRVLDADFNLALHGVVGRLTLTPEPLRGGISFEGTLAGGIAVDDFKDIVQNLTISSDVMSATSGLIGLLADLAPDEETGRCTQVSAALRIEATPAFIHEGGAADQPAP